MKHKRKIVGGCVLMWFLCQQIVFGKVFDEAQAVRYEEYAASHTIEDSTLLIGTYLIHLQALTDELYEKALESASDSNQMNVYYKSELASGTWMDITDAVGLSDLSGQGRVAQAEEMADLWVTCCTGSDGITRDARDEHSINIFSEPSPYDLYSLPELEPLKIQYSNVFSSDSTGVDRYYFKKLRDFFSLNLRNETTEACDLQLLGLQSCYESLRVSKEEELAEIVSKLMSKVDARRRAEIFYRLAEMDGNELSILQDICAGSQFYEDGKESEDEEEEKEVDKYDDQQFVENAGVIDAIGTSIQNCQESYIKYSGTMLEEGSTILKQAEYEKSMAVVEMAAGGYSNEMESLLLELKHLYHIEEDIVADADAELLLLNGELISQADVKYAQKLSQGVAGAYETAVANRSGQTVIEQVLEDQKADTDAARLELQYLLQAKTKRQPASDAAEFSYQRITYAEELYPQVASDDFKPKATESIDAHILWLKELAHSVEEKEEDMASDMQKLEQKKTKLLQEQTEALDHNDLSSVRKYEVMIAQVDQEIEETQKALQAVLSSSTSSAADRARAANLAGTTSVLNNIGRLKDAALSEIAEGNQGSTDSIAGKLDALAALGAESAIQEICDKLEASGTDNRDLIAKAQEAINESRESSLHGQYGGTGGDAQGAESAAGEGSAQGGSQGGTTSAVGGDSGSGGTGTSGGRTSEDEAGTDGSQTDTGPAGDQTGAEAEGAGADGTNSDAGDGDASSTMDAEEDLINAIENGLEQTFDNMNDSQKAAAIAALDSLGQSGNQTAAALARRLVNEGIQEGNPWLYQKLKKEAERYIPLPLIASSTGYRYLYSDSRTEVLLSKKQMVYRFTIHRGEVSLLDGQIEELHAPVKMQDGTPYLSEEDAGFYFSCEAVYIENTDYGVCLGPKASVLKKAILAAIEEGA